MVVETDAGAPIEADIVGEARGHYVAVAPPGTQPLAVVTYASDGRELDRLSLLGDGPDGWRMSEPEIDCHPGPDGSYECEGVASGSGGGRMEVRCEETENGELVCAPA